MQEKGNAILKLTIDFSIKAIAFVELLEAQRKYVVAKQLLRSATSVGANVHEAQNAESKADFIHKLKIAHKEADETMYWLTICERAESYPGNTALKDDLLVISKVLSKIIASTKQKMKTPVN